VTADLVQRIWQHRGKLVAGLTKRYGVPQLAWFETHDDIMEAIKRDKQLKEWKRARKIEPVQAKNPHWRDLYDDICR